MPEPEQWTVDSMDITADSAVHLADGTQPGGEADSDEHVAVVPIIRRRRAMIREKFLASMPGNPFTRNL